MSPTNPLKSYSRLDLNEYFISAHLLAPLITPIYQISGTQISLLFFLLQTPSSRVGRSYTLSLSLDALRCTVGSVLLLRDSARWRGGPDLSPGMSQRSGSRGGGMPVQGLALAQAPRVSPTFALLRQTDRRTDGLPASLSVHGLTRSLMFRAADSVIRHITHCPLYQF